MFNEGDVTSTIALLSLTWYATGHCKIQNI